MKKIYSLLSITLLTATVATAQVDIQDYNGGAPTGSNLNGTIITKTVSDNELVVVDIGITNKSGSDKSLDITRLKIVDMPAWSGGSSPEQICWAPTPDLNFEGVCLIPNSNPWTTPNNFTVPNNGLTYLKFDIHTYGAGSIHYRFYVMDGSTKVDSVDVMVSTTLGIKDKKNEEISMSIYPNPATSILNISAQGLDGNYDVRMTDVLGKVVYNETVIGSSKKVDVSDFKNGVYLVTITEKGTAIQTRRIVVKH